MSLKSLSLSELKMYRWDLCVKKKKNVTENKALVVE